MPRNSPADKFVPPPDTIREIAAAAIFLLPLVMKFMSPDPPYTSCTYETKSTCKDLQVDKKVPKRKRDWHKNLA